MCRIAPTLRRFVASAIAAAGLAAVDAGTDGFSATSAFAQPPSDDRGGDRGGGDRGRRMFDPEEMIARMDENKNGQIDPEEMQGRSRFFLESMARDNGLDLSKPIPTAKLKEIMQARFQQGGGGSRGPGSGPGNGSGPGSGSSASAATKPTTIPPMGFGVETTTAKVPGFGPDATADSWDTIKAKYDQRIVDRVQESLNRYDANKDGILDAEEIKKGQWRSDPKESDLNKDGKLSRGELAERQRLRDQNGGGGGSGGGRPSFGGGPPGGFSGGGFGGGGFNGGGFGGGRAGPTSATTTPAASSTTATAATTSSSSSSSSGSSGGAAQIAGYADGLLKQYDTNKDGVLQRDEWSQMNSKRQKADTNNDGLITKDEIIAQLSDYSKSSGGSSSGSSGSPTYGARAASSGAVKTYRFLAPVERLPKGLPDWFARSDANGDGQIAMAEFSAAWDEAKAAEFAKWDRNGDGLITPRECTSEK